MGLKGQGRERGTTSPKSSSAGAASALTGPYLDCAGAEYGAGSGRSVTGRFSGVGRVAGRKLAYVAWSDGRVSEFTLSAFRERFGVSALVLPTGSTVVGRPERPLTDTQCDRLTIS